MPEQIAVALQILSVQIEFDDLVAALAKPVDEKRHLPGGGRDSACGWGR